jgi:hypothetical protein
MAIKNSPIEVETRAPGTTDRYFLAMSIPCNNRSIFNESSSRFPKQFGFTLFHCPFSFISVFTADWASVTALRLIAVVYAMVE